MVCDFKKAFNEAKRNTIGEVDEIKSRKHGRSTLLPEELMQKTIETIQALQLNGAPVTATVINAIAKGIVTANDCTILVEHGGYLSLSYDWAKAVQNGERGQENDVKNGNHRKNTSGSRNIEGS